MSPDPVPAPHRPRARPTEHAPGALALSPLAALLAWLAVLVVLNLTVQPLVAGATWVGLASLAAVTGRLRLITLSLLVGVGLLLVIPGVAFADGSWRFSFAGGAHWLPDGSVAGAALAVGSMLRVPAQVLAVVLMALVPAELLLSALARCSPKSALLGGLAVRLHPLLLRDLGLVRDELASRGRRFDTSAPLQVRVSSWVAVWNAMVGGACDRAFATAAALEVRGYGRHRPTTAPFATRDLAARIVRRPALDAAVSISALGAVVLAIWGRSTGALAAPVFEVFSGVHEPMNWVSVMVAAAGLAIGVIPAAAHVRARGANSVAGSDDALSAAGGTAVSARPSLQVLEATERRSRPPAGRGVSGTISISSLVVRYPTSDAPALDIAQLEVDPGTFVVLTGPSGGGKSTLLDAISGVAPFATGGSVTGRISISGRDVVGQRSVARSNLVAAVFQDPERQVVVGRVAEEVAFNLRHSGLEIAEIERRVRDALTSVECLHLAHRDCATLSGGELQRVLLAAALASRCDVLLLDEPTSQLDAASEGRFWEHVRRLQHECGTTVVASEHRIDHVRSLCDRVVVIREGRIASDIRGEQIDTVDAELGSSPYFGLAPVPVAVDQAPRMWLSNVTVRPAGAVAGVGDASGRSIVRGVDLVAHPGSIITLEGPNGVGKSTLLRALRGIHDHDGTVYVDGVARRGVAESARSIAWVSQQAGPVLDARTVADQAADAARRLGGWGPLTGDALIAAGLYDRASSHPSELSVGERQRLTLIASTSHRPPVWLLDEPTRGMDRVARRWLALQVLDHARRGGVAVIATHDPALAAALSTHRLLLDRDMPPRLIAVVRSGDGTPVAGQLPPAAAVRRSPSSRHGGVGS